MLVGIAQTGSAAMMACKIVFVVGQSSGLPHAVGRKTYLHRLYQRPENTPNGRGVPIETHSPANRGRADGPALVSGQDGVTVSRVARAEAARGHTRCFQHGMRRHSVPPSQVGYYVPRTPAPVRRELLERAVHTHSPSNTESRVQRPRRIVNIAEVLPLA
jgi:hypothetical protein